MIENASRIGVVAIFALGLATSAVPPVAMAQEGPAKGDASKHFALGVSLFKSGDYEGALVEFRAAYEAKPFFSVRYNIGMSLYKLHRYSEAYEELETYILEGGDGVEEGRSQEVLGILDELEDLIGTLDISCSVDGAKLIVDDEAMGFGKLKLDVGEHLVEVSAAGYEPYLYKVSLPGGKDLALAVHLEPFAVAEPSEPEATPEPEAVEPEPPEHEPAVLEGKPASNGGKKLRPPAFYALLAATLVAGGAAVITGSLAVGKRREYGTLTWDDPGWKGVKSSGQNLAIATDVLLATAGALAVTTLVVALFTDFKKEEGPHDGTSMGLKLVPLMPGLALEGRF